MQVRSWRRTLFFFLCIATTGATAEVPSDAWLESIRQSQDVPALGVLIAKDGLIVEHYVVGERKFGSGVAATKSDPWHLGSNTISVTATMIARLVERGLISFDTTIHDVFPDLIDTIDPGFHNVTLRELLSHQAGLGPKQGIYKFMGYFWSEETITDQRIDYMQDMMKQPPLYEPGSEYHYANAGYIIAGAMVERLTGRPWEKLVATEVMEPLGITRFGFGAPGLEDAINQPWGHKNRMIGFGRVAMNPNLRADNPPTYGPAGTLHLSLEDWATYAIDHIKGERGEGRLLSQKMYQYLHTIHRPIDGKSGYAMGWGVGKLLGTDIRVLTHAGSNTMWYAMIDLMPEEDLVILVVCNDGTKKGSAATSEARAAARKIYFPEITTVPSR